MIKFTLHNITLHKRVSNTVQILQNSLKTVFVKNSNLLNFLVKISTKIVYRIEFFSFSCYLNVNNFNMIFKHRILTTILNTILLNMKS